MDETLSYKVAEPATNQVGLDDYVVTARTDRCDPSRGNIKSGASSRLAIALVLCGPLSLLVIPGLWWLGCTLLQALLLNTLFQVLVACCVVAPGFSSDYAKAATENRNIKALKEVEGSPAVWRSYSNRLENGDVPRVALIAPASVQTHRIANDVVEQGYDIHHTDDVDGMLDAVQTRPIDWSFIIFDLDLSDDLDHMVGELMSFRVLCPDIPILLLSRCATRDEFSDHRRAIGDVTLRKPVFRNRLLAGIDAMKTNCRKAERVHA